MLTHLRIQNFKSWRDTGAMRFAPLTGFFGANSSGKSSILQFLLMLKQTAESIDYEQVLNLGVEQNAYVDLGRFSEIVFNQSNSPTVSFELAWIPDALVDHELVDTQGTSLQVPSAPLASTNTSRRQQLSPVHLEAQIGLVKNVLVLKRLFVAFNAIQPFRALLERHDQTGANNEYDYRFESEYIARDGSVQSENVDVTISTMNLFALWLLDFRHKFPLSASVSPVNGDAFSASKKIPIVQRSLNTLLNRIGYLGPLREYPNRLYLWRGNRVGNIGIKGEQAVQALLSTTLTLSSKTLDTYDPTAQVADWLRTLGLIHSFEIRPIAEGRSEYEVVVRQSVGSPPVLLTNVGFGISQVLPVLALCALTAPGDTIILEQPEIHLHPAVQAGLADVFVDVIKTRNIQIILESHSEHLLIRLQRRMAEERLMPEDVALYFTRIEDGESKLEELQIDQYGNIRNWPDYFFGDRMGDLVAMTEAAMGRQISQPVNGTSG